MTKREKLLYDALVRSRTNELMARSMMTRVYISSNDATKRAESEIHWHQIAQNNYATVLKLQKENDFIADSLQNAEVRIKEIQQDRDRFIIDNERLNKECDILRMNLAEENGELTRQIAMLKAHK